MSHTARLKRPPAAFRQLTGITRAAFDRLRADLEPRYAAADPASDPGQRRFYGGRRSGTRSSATWR